MRRYRQPPPRTGLGLVGRILLGVIAVIVMLAAALAGGAWLYFDQTVEAVQAHSKGVIASQPYLSKPGSPDKPTIALLLGYDQRFKETDPGRSDTLMLVRADPTTNSILEIRPQGRSGGEVVWRIEEVQNPWDVTRLDNGNTLVTERYNSRVVEYDAKSREVVWQAIATYPMAAQRLENGNTLITTNNAVFEVNHDPQPREQWRANLLRAGTIRPHRAVRLENGNTLITDQQKGQVVELDSNSVEVWKVTGLVHPAQAVRLEDGNTLILEQGANRVVEIDPANPRNRTEILKRGLSVPMGMTTY